MGVAAGACSAVRSLSGRAARLRRAARPKPAKNKRPLTNSLKATESGRFDSSEAAPAGTRKSESYLRQAA